MKLKLFKSNHSNTYCTVAIANISIMYLRPQCHLCLDYHLCLQVPRSVLEDEQGNRVPLLSPTHRQWTPEPDGLLCHVHHVQGHQTTHGVFQLAPLFYEPK